MAQKKTLKFIPITLELVSRSLPVRPRNASKETFGRVLVLAGSRSMTGAAMLCSRSVLRAGAGISILGIPRSLEDLVDVANPEVMALGLPETKNITLAPAAYLPIRKILPKMRVLAVGPGLSRSRPTTVLIKKLYRLYQSGRLKSGLVIDADGLAGLIRFRKRTDAEDLPIITPHAGELAKLLGVPRISVEKEPVAYACRAADRYNVVVVLKSHRTIIVAPHEEQVLRNELGNAGMATGGAGDVLTGTIAGLLAQGLGSWTAAAVGVYVHSLAGNIAALRLGQDGIIASDIMESLPLALKRIRGK